MTIGEVIDAFRSELPDATIYVYDNNSSDATAQVAKKHGAIVRTEPRQGKGNVVRSMFRHIDADIYVMADGDGTYPADRVHELIAPVRDGLCDMSVGDRHSSGSYKEQNRRPFHNFGNHLVTFLINRLFGAHLKDIMSGYRVFNRHFVKNMPIQSSGFEIETELTLQSLDKHWLIREIPIDYYERPAGSHSKLNTVKDGLKILKTILWIFKDFQPLKFFLTLGGLFFILGLFAGVPVILEFVQTGYVSKLPSAILAIGLMLISVLSLFSGFILDTIVKLHRERYELDLMRYLESIRSSQGGPNDSK